MISRNTVATLKAENPVGKAPRCTPLENLSTTTKIIVKPLEGGRWVTKSMEMSSHTPVGAGRGCSRPAMRLVLALFY